ncbi:MAG: GYF domain-containing protein [Kiritimatiellia bacterium]|nr:GYF domain-containing protein [Kiritimatiellia bacterium]MDP6810801.1 GYF domain-containing protein [Kiritimatiellia bacterium]MDP7024143.1 GYF domain-containing protein [Kiritimatiellia bacterium]
MADDKCRARFEYGLKVLKIDRTTTSMVPLFPEGTVFHEITLNGDAIVPVKQEGWICAEIKTLGDHRVDCRVDVKPETVDGVTSCTLKKAMFVRSIVHVDSDRALEFSIEDFGQSVTGTPDEGTHGTLYAGVLEDLTIRWQIPREEPVQQGSLSVTPSTVWTIREKPLAAEVVLDVAIRKDVIAEQTAAAEMWYYAEGESFAGPVGLETVRSMILSRQLPEDVPLCKEGEDVWVLASQVLGPMAGAAATPREEGQTPLPDPSSAAGSSNNQEGGERVCLHCGRIHRATGAFCQHCGKPLGSAKKKVYGGLTRLAYVGVTFAIGLLHGLLAALVGSVEGHTVLGVVFGMLYIIPIVCRLQNTGTSGWLSLVTFIPIANVFLGIYCLAYPEGYQDSRELDDAGKIVVCLVGGLVVLGILLAILAIAMSA